LLFAALRLRDDFLTTFGRDYVIWPLAFAVTTSWISLGGLLVSWYFPADMPEWAAVLLAVLGPLWLLTATLVGAIVFAAFRHAKQQIVLERVDADSRHVGVVLEIERGAEVRRGIAPLLPSGRMIVVERIRTHRKHIAVRTEVEIGREDRIRIASFAPTVGIVMVERAYPGMKYVEVLQRKVRYRRPDFRRRD